MQIEPLPFGPYSWERELCNELARVHAIVLAIGTRPLALRKSKNDINNLIS